MIDLPKFRLSDKIRLIVALRIFPFDTLVSHIFNIMTVFYNYPDFFMNICINLNFLQSSKVYKINCFWEG